MVTHVNGLLSEGMTHSTSVQLATDAAGHPHALARAFNTFDPEILDLMYEPGSVFVPRPGEPTTGSERLRANGEFLALRVPIRVTPRRTYQAGDIALLIVDWLVEGVAADGSDVRIAGTATDIARRGEDGFWRYVVDNPFGVADHPDSEA